MTQIGVVIFDCDGVMFDSKKANETYYNTLLGKIGLPKMSKEQSNFIHSHSVNESLAYLVENASLLTIVKEYKQHLGYDNFIKLMKIEPTLLSVLRSLCKKFRIAIATNRTNTIRQILKHYKLSHLFDPIVCSSDVAFPKPDPGMLNEIIKRLNIHSSQAVFIGDSKLDELASALADIRFIAYKNRNINACAHIDSLSMIESVITKL